MSKCFALVAAVCCAHLNSSALAAQTTDTLRYQLTSVMVPMRDGVRLNTHIYAPQDQKDPLPFVMVRTPYGIEADSMALKGPYKTMADQGYIFVSQDIRGRYASEGEFLMNRPLHDPADSTGVDESTDTYDTVEWLLKNVPNNSGAVGVLGISYPGWLAAMAGINPHPAVKAVSPQAPMTDTWMGDDFFHQGAFRQSYGFEYATDLELSKDESVPLPIDRYDTYDFYLAHSPLSKLTDLLAGRVPDLDQLRRASRLRRLLEGAFAANLPDPAERTDAHGWRVVGPGRLLRRDQDLRDTRAARQRWQKLRRARPLESRQLEPRQGRQARQHLVRE